MADLAKLAKDIGTVALLRGDYVLRSGARSSVYFDKYQFEARPELLRRVAEELAHLLPAEVDVLAGLELGGIPLVTVLSQITGLPAAFVRKQPKTYGTSRITEGATIANRRVAVIEDVVTSGGAIIDALPHLQAEAADVRLAVCVVLRQESASHELARHGIRLLSLLTLQQVSESAG